MDKSNQNIISFVVGALPINYFQAELLLASLEHFGKYPKELILVQCVNCVDKTFITFLNSKGYRFRLIESNPDEISCNKSEQLETFSDEENDSMFLLETNMFVLEPLSPTMNDIPIHSTNELHSFLPKIPVFILHYHNLITPFGLLNKIQVANNKKAVKTIDKVNHFISKTKQFEFFEDYKRACVKPLRKTQQIIDFNHKLTNLISPIQRRLKFILHAGTPKSGTTSLQFYMAKHQQTLKANGILYPDHFYNVTPPKHQWLVQNLINADAAKLYNNIKTVLNNIEENTHTIFLSTEGIFNHWWDFPEESKALLAELTNCFDVCLWVCLRDPLSFAESYYKQNIKNPRIPNINCYGNDLSFEEMLNDEWFNHHFDYLGFLYECEMLFGKNNVESFDYKGEVIQIVFKKLGLPNPIIEKEPRENSGLCAAATNLLRVINRYPLSPAEKQQTIPYINKLNEILSTHSTESLINAEAQKQLLEMTSLVNKK